MNQEITISRNTIPYIADNLPALEINNAQRLIEKIKENYFVVDKNLILPQLLWQETKKITDETVRKYLQEILKKLLDERKTYIQYEFEQEEILAQKSEDKIFIDPLLTPKEIKKTEKKYAIEVHNDMSFISPKIYQKLKHSNCKLKFEENVIYDFQKIFTPYLRKTQSLIVEDPFLPNPKAFFNFKQLIEVFEGNRIKVKFHSQHNYLKYNHENKKFYLELENFLDHLEKQGLTVEVENFEKRKHYERYIYTDFVKIKLPGGLDFLDKNGENKSQELIEVEISKLTKS